MGAGASAAMAVPPALLEAGMKLEYQEDGCRLIVRDAGENACDIRNRAGQALSMILKNHREVKVLDLSQSGMADNSIGHICMVLRQTNQLEELALSPLGHAGVEFLLGVVRRCSRLRTLRIKVVDTLTRVAAGQNVVAGDYDTSKFEGTKNPDDEEEEEEAAAEEVGDDDEEITPEERERRKLEALRKVFAENDYDSGDEEGGPAVRAPSKSLKPTSSVLSTLLTELVVRVRQAENLTTVELLGDAVPEDVRTDLSRAVGEHQRQQQRKVEAKQERGARTALDALQAQAEELRTVAEGAGKSDMTTEGLLPGEEGDSAAHVGLRSFVGRRLFAALGEALFECQRFKSKENEAVATWQGEAAFLAMYLRKLAREQGR